MEPMIGISPIERGNFVHHALEIIWNKLQDHQTLCDMPQSNLLSCISETVDFVINDYSANNPSVTQPLFLSTERKRLKQLLEEWLTLEKSRTPFKVLQCEAQRHVKIAGLTLNLRIDRIDALENGSQIIIDYKTGKSNMASWFTERINEPQLPLYCTFNNDPPQHMEYSGITFAEVRTGNMKFKGLLHERNSEYNFGEPNDLFSNVIPINQLKDQPELLNWQDQINRWQESLEQLSQDFCQGDAKVDPIDEQSCSLCDLQSLCRIFQS